MRPERLFPHLVVFDLDGLESTDFVGAEHVFAHLRREEVDRQSFEQHSTIDCALISMEGKRGLALIDERAATSTED